MKFRKLDRRLRTNRPGLRGELLESRRVLAAMFAGPLALRDGIGDSIESAGPMVRSIARPSWELLGPSLVLEGTEANSTSPVAATEVGPEQEFSSPDRLQPISSLEQGLSILQGPSPQQTPSLPQTPMESAGMSHDALLVAAVEVAAVDLTMDLSTLRQELFSDVPDITDTDVSKSFSMSVTERGLVRAIDGAPGLDWLDGSDASRKDALEVVRDLSTDPLTAEAFVEFGGRGGDNAFDSSLPDFSSGKSALDTTSDYVPIDSRFFGRNAGLEAVEFSAEDFAGLSAEPLSTAGHDIGLANLPGIGQFGGEAISLPTISLPTLLTGSTTEVSFGTASDFVVPSATSIELSLSPMLPFLLSLSFADDSAVPGDMSPASGGLQLDSPSSLDVFGASSSPSLQDNGSDPFVSFDDGSDNFGLSSLPPIEAIPANNGLTVPRIDPDGPGPKETERAALSESDDSPSRGLLVTVDIGMRRSDSFGDWHVAMIEAASTLLVVDARSMVPARTYDPANTLVSRSRSFEFAQEESLTQGRARAVEQETSKSWQAKSTESPTSPIRRGEAAAKTGDSASARPSLSPWYVFFSSFGGLGYHDMGVASTMTAHRSPETKDKAHSDQAEDDDEAAGVAVDSVVVVLGGFATLILARQLDPEDQARGRIGRWSQF